MDDKLSILIPAYNEEKSILRTLKSIADQKLSPEIKLEVLVITNSCTDDTEKIVESFISKYKGGSISWKLIKSSERGKTRALNKGLENTSSEIVGYIDADVVLPDDTVSALFNALKNDINLTVVGATPEATFDNLDPKLLLVRVEKLYNAYFHHGGHSIPVGRCIFFRRNTISSFPENIGSEDTWLSLSAMKSHGIPSVQIFPDKVYYTPPQNWEDWLKQRSRFNRVTEQLFEVFPDLKTIQQEFVKQRRRSLGELFQEMKPILEREGITEELALWVKNFLHPLVKENSQLRKNEILDSNGNWDPVKSTKS